MSADTSRTSLTRFANSMRDPDPDGARKAARALWHGLGVVVIFPGDLTGLDKEFVTAIANRIHGRRS